MKLVLCKFWSKIITNLDKNEVRELIKEVFKEMFPDAIKEVIEKELFKERLSMIPTMSKKEQQAIENKLGKTPPPKNVAYTNYLDI